MIKNKLWYAVLTHSDDLDWGYGSYDESEAIEMANYYAELYPENMIRISVIDQGPDGNADPICIEERIIQEGE